MSRPERAQETSIPHVALVIFDFIPFQERPKFVLKSQLFMVGLLVADVSFYRRHIRLTDRERSITRLPEKARELLSPSLDPFRRSFLDLFHNVLQGVVLRKAKENVDVVGYGVHQD